MSSNTAPTQSTSERPGPIVVGVTGASGVVYAQRLVQFLLHAGEEVFLTISSAGRLVLGQELPTERGTDPWGETHRDRLTIFPERDFFAPFCSGTFRFRSMVIVPASMGTVGAVANGICLNNIHRGADVALKERRRLVIVPRETPFTQIHLENLLSLARAGATVLPPSPAFYQQPASLDDVVDFVVSRILDALDIDNSLFPRWREDDLQGDQPAETP
ncbi:MAG: UbiX family flavin prenyltransferase [Planctomycetes bacterium]|nr:UbiX family flavin prenyltransferase [Planctomycetota bacterium]